MNCSNLDCKTEHYYESCFTKECGNPNCKWFVPNSQSAKAFAKSTLESKSRIDAAWCNEVDRCINENLLLYHPSIIEHIKANDYKITLKDGRIFDIKTITNDGYRIFFAANVIDKNGILYGTSMDIKKINEAIMLPETPIIMGDVECYLQSWSFDLEVNDLIMIDFSFISVKTKDKISR
jgi:hypothetical protein